MVYGEWSATRKRYLDSEQVTVIGSPTAAIGTSKQRRLNFSVFWLGMSQPIFFLIGNVKNKFSNKFIFKKNNQCHLNFLRKVFVYV